MISNNIITIILILLVIGAIVYIYYTYFNYDALVNYNKLQSNSNRLPCRRQAHVLQSRSFQNKKSNLNPAKRVRFNDNVLYNWISPHSDTASPMNSILSPINSPTKLSNKLCEQLSISSDRLSETELINKNDEDITLSPIKPSNLDQFKQKYIKIDPEETWDASFGLPLMSRDEQKSYFNKMQQNFQKYEKALGAFAEYQTDQSTIIKTETTIDPFKPDHRSDSILKGRTVKDIYDQQVAGPKAKPKQVKHRTATGVIYKDESVMNGGVIPGTNDLYGFDGTHSTYKTAAFGNEFN